MKAVVFGFVLMALTAVCMAEVGRMCTEKSQCAADECCQIINIVIASRKRQLHHLTRPNTSGTCQKYSQAGDTCNPFDVMNGYCGCAEGMSCITVHANTTPKPTARLLDIMAAPRKLAPGYMSVCAAN